MYIKPPRGDIQLSELTECAITRIKYFLLKYQQCPDITKESLKFDYLTLGTALDRVGHFVLRLLAANSFELRDFIATSEASFVVERLEHSSKRQIIQLLSTTLRHVEEAGSSNYINIIWRTEMLEIFNVIKSVFKSSHMEGFSHDENCTQFELKVPFQMCLKLVARRELHLEKGKVLVPCGKWKSFLNCFLEAFFIKEINKMGSSKSFKESMADERLNELKNTVMKLIGSKRGQHYSEENISSDQLKDLQQFFPPCMLYLYNNLKTNHRLSHYARFNFSLFLKDIGMSLNESIDFWRTEYTKPGKCKSKCSHSWQKDSAKYTYSIRHLYGLEGKRANYCVPSCTKIQNNNLGPTEEGGCPFVNFDETRLQRLLDPNTLLKREELEMVMHLKSNDQTKACDYYKKTVLKAAKIHFSSDTVVHKTPGEYFYLLKRYYSKTPIKTDTYVF